MMIQRECVQLCYNLKENKVCYVIIIIIIIICITGIKGTLESFESAVTKCSVQLERIKERREKVNFQLMNIVTSHIGCRKV